MAGEKEQSVIAQCEQKHVFLKKRGSKKLCPVCFPPVKKRKKKGSGR